MSGDYYISLPQTLPIHAGHEFGELDRLRRKVGNDVVWFHADSTLLRDGQVRVQMIQTSLHISATVPFNVRNELDGTINRLMEQPAPNIAITEEDSGYQNRDGTVRIQAGKAFVLSSMDKRIALKVGKDPRYWNQYEKIEIEVKEGVSAEELYTFLASLGLASMLLNARPEDIVRQRLARLAAAERPGAPCGSPESWAREGQALGLEERALGMRPSSIARADLSEDVDPVAVEMFKVQGGVGFAATVGCNRRHNLIELVQTWSLYEIDPALKTAETLEYICYDGFYSSIERFERGIVGKGCCPERNMETGSANQVFTRVLTANQFSGNGYDWSNLAIPGSVFVLIRPEAAERLPYAYRSDHLGLRSPLHRGPMLHLAHKEYPGSRMTGERITERVPIAQLAQEQNHSTTVSPTAEVMFEQKLSVNYVAGFVVATEQDRSELLQGFYARNISMLNNHPIEDVVVVAQHLNAKAKKLLED